MQHQDVQMPLAKWIMQMLNTERNTLLQKGVEIVNKKGAEGIEETTFINQGFVF